MGNRRRHSGVAQSNLWPMLALVVILVVVMALVVYVLRDARQTAEIATQEARNAAQPPQAIEDPEPPAAVWIGDSYTAGTGAQNPEFSGYVAQVSNSLGWRAFVEGQGGTSFTADGRDLDRASDTLINRLDPIANEYAGIDVIVTDAGRNEYLRPDSVDAAVNAYFTKLRSEFPNADLVTLIPFAIDKPVDRFNGELEQALRNATARVGGFVIDPQGEGWLPAPGGLGTMTAAGDPGHPSQEGYDYISSYLSDDFRELDLAVRISR